MNARRYHADEMAWCLNAGYVADAQFHARAYAALEGRHPRLEFVAHCVRRWTIDLVVDVARFVVRRVRGTR